MNLTYVPTYIRIHVCLYVVYLVSVLILCLFHSFADTYVVAWKRGIAILTAGSVKVTPDPRVRLVNGFNLQIRDAVPQDAGDYICQIATMEPREITHTVEILGKLQKLRAFKLWVGYYTIQLSGSLVIVL